MGVTNKIIIKVIIFVIVIFVLGIVISSVIPHGDEYTADVSGGIHSGNTANGDNGCRVHIKGAVRNPGVYVVEEKLIVSDVLTLAGGYSANADTDYLNLSQKVFDGMEIMVPERKADDILETYKGILDMNGDE